MRQEQIAQTSASQAGLSPGCAYFSGGRDPRFICLTFIYEGSLGSAQRETGGAAARSALWAAFARAAHGLKEAWSLKQF